MAKEKKDSKDDFDPQELAKTTDKHEADIARLLKRLKKIEDILKPEGFIKFLEKVQEGHKKMDSFFAKIFTELMKIEGKAKEAIRELIRAEDKNAVIKFLKRFGGIVGFLVSIAVTALITALITLRISGKE